jgi:hypothetical protein
VDQKQQPKVLGSVSVLLLEGGGIGVNVAGGISQLTAVGLLAAGQKVVLENPPKEQRRIIPVQAVPDLDKGNGKK